jgi:predicted GNAT family N-acyltransferase
MLKKDSVAEIGKSIVVVKSLRGSRLGKQIWWTQLFTLQSSPMKEIIHLKDQIKLLIGKNQHCNYQSQLSFEA